MTGSRLVSVRTPVKQIRAVWTDFGGVLTPPAPESMDAYCTKVGIAPDTLARAMTTVARTYGVRDPMAPLDTPLVSEHDWARQVEQVLARDFAVDIDLGDPGEALFAHRPVNLPWLAWLARLRAGGIFVGLLSNMVPTWEPRWQLMVPRTFFDGVVLSHEVGFRKPAREIFVHAATIAGFDADACALVDDLAVNCAGAEAAGWRAIEFADTAAAVDRLASWTGVPGPGADTPAARTEKGLLP